jgi:glycosyltransferase involved in cell wall biosynthesis
MGALNRVNAPWKLLLVGAGPLERVLRQWAAEHENRVRFATDVAHARMARYLNAMDILAVPSRTTPRWREQFGRVIVEAMACGVPVVGSDSGEVPHVIGDAGVVVPEGHVEQWTRALAALVVDAEVRRDLSQRGRRRALTFGVDVVARRQMAFFEELLAQPPREAGR